MARNRIQNAGDRVQKRSHNLDDENTRYDHQDDNYERRRFWIEPETAQHRSRRCEDGIGCAPHIARVPGKRIHVDVIEDGSQNDEHDPGDDHRHHGPPNK